MLFSGVGLEMALAFALILAGSLWFASAPAAAQDGPVPASAEQAFAPAASSQAAAPSHDAIDPSLSPECRVPGSKLYTIASLRTVKAALRKSRAIKVLAIGSSSTVGVGASSPLASYPVRLEGELEKLFPGVEVDVTNRGISGEGAAGAAQRLRSTIVATEPDLVVWQVGTNDALARVGLRTFAQSLEETIEWLKSKKIDLVLVDPQYTVRLARDDYYKEIVTIIQDTAQRNRVPLVQRYESMRYLANHKPEGLYLALDHFHLNDLGYRCMAEHVARAVTVSLLQPEAVAPNGANPP